MKPLIISIQVFIFYLILSIITCAQASDTEEMMLKSYLNADYVTVASLLEEEIGQLENNKKDTRSAFRKLYNKKIMLAYIFAWKLNNPKEALKIYKDVNQLRQSYKDSAKIPAIELLNIAEVYESEKELSKAEKYYRRFLNEITSFKKNENDDFSIMIADELIRLTKYQIDSINLKKDVELLLPELKFSSIMAQGILPVLYASIFPLARYENDIVLETGLNEYIKKNVPENLSYMFFEFSLIIITGEDNMDESIEQAYTYIAKYPQSYFSLLLRHMLYKYYSESDQKRKAEVLLAELKEIGKNRGMEMIIGPDERFSSPEKTWATYKKALIEGDITLALECHVPGDNEYAEIYQAMGPERLNEMALKMRPIEKITSDETSAKYRIKRDLNGTDITYFVYFTNINGEWKILQY